MQSAYRAHKAKTEFHALWAQIAESVEKVERFLPYAFSTEQLAWIDSHYKDIENKLNRVKQLRWINETERATLIGASEEKLNHFRSTIDSRRASSSVPSVGGASVPSAGGASAGASDSDSEGAAGAGKATVVEDPLLAVQRRVDNFLRRRDNGEFTGDHGRAELQNISDELRVIYQGAGPAADDIKEKIDDIIHKGITGRTLSSQSRSLFGRENKCFQWFYDLDSVELPVAVAPLTFDDICFRLRALEEDIWMMNSANRDTLGIAFRALSAAERDVKLKAVEKQVDKIRTDFENLEKTGAISEASAMGFRKKLSKNTDSLLQIRVALNKDLARERR